MHGRRARSRSPAGDACDVDETRSTDSTDPGSISDFLVPDVSEPPFLHRALDAEADRAGDSFQWPFLDPFPDDMDREASARHQEEDLAAPTDPVTLLWRRREHELRRAQTEVPPEDATPVCDAAESSSSSGPRSIFRNRASCVFLTYSQVLKGDAAPIDRADYVQTFLTQYRPRWQHGVAVLEPHQDGNVHMHAVLYRDPIWEIRDSRYFDFKGTHPNIQSVRVGHQKVLNYVYKTKPAYWASWGRFADPPWTHAPLAAAASDPAAKNAKRSALGLAILDGPPAVYRFVSDNPEMAARLASLIKSSEEAGRIRSAVAPAVRRDVRLVWHYGESGAGKTTDVYQAHPDVVPLDCPARGQQQWLSAECRDASALLFDNVDRNTLPQHNTLLKLADGWKATYPYKGGMTSCDKVNVIFVTSVYPPWVIYEEQWGSGELKRRITSLRHFVSGKTPGVSQLVARDQWQ